MVEEVEGICNDCNGKMILKGDNIWYCPHCDILSEWNDGKERIISSEQIETGTIRIYYDKNNYFQIHADRIKTGRLNGISTLYRNGKVVAAIPKNKIIRVVQKEFSN